MDGHKINRAHEHFNNVEQYLKQRFDIRLRAEIVKKILGELTSADIVDFGCGDGTISLQFQSATNHVTLVDISENMLRKSLLNTKPKYSHRVSRMRSDVSIFVSKKKYDVVLAIGLLAHVDSVPASLKQMAEIVKEGGVCLVQITDDTLLFSKLLRLYNKILDRLTGQFGYKRNRLSVKEIVAIAGKYSLVYEKSVQYSLTFPGMASLLPDKLMYQYHSFVRKSRLLSNLGTDFILCFRKQIR